MKIDLSAYRDWAKTGRFSGRFALHKGLIQQRACALWFPLGSVFLCLSHSRMLARTAHFFFSQAKLPLWLLYYCQSPTGF